MQASACRRHSASGPRKSTTASWPWPRSSRRTFATTNLTVAFIPAELTGVPESLWRDAKHDAQGRVLLAVDDADLPAGHAGRDRPGGARAHVARQDQRGRAGQPETAGRDRPIAQGVAQLFGPQLRRFQAAPAHGARRGQRAGAFSPRSDRQWPSENAPNSTRCGRPRRGLGFAADGHVKLERWDLPYYTERVVALVMPSTRRPFAPTFPRRKAWPW